jgi:hypothetical protein
MGFAVHEGWQAVPLLFSREGGGDEFLEGDELCRDVACYVPTWRAVKYFYTLTSKLSDLILGTITYCTIIIYS